MTGQVQESQVLLTRRHM